MQNRLQNHLLLIIQLTILTYVFINILYYIHIGGNNIGDEGAKAIAESLKINNSINSINLGNLYKLIYYIYIGSNNIGNEGAKAIAESLKINNSIYSINLGNLYKI